LGILEDIRGEGESADRTPWSLIVEEGRVRGHSLEGSVRAHCLESQWEDERKKGMGGD
jgi:hypothetical protein